MSVNPVISCEDLSFGYDSVNILENVSFEVFQGDFIGIIGPNGGGKTTLLKLILGFLKPRSGRLLVLGKTPEQVQGKIAYVPQSLRYDRHFPISTMELVLGGRLSHLPWYGIFGNKDKERALEALDEVGLLHLKDKSFGELSGGQQQRALIARALASNPEILLLDEPTASVDMEAEQTIFQILQNLKKKITILMVTHDLQTAVDKVDRVLCVQGNVLSYSPTQVCEHFALGLYHAPLIGLKSTKGS